MELLRINKKKKKKPTCDVRHEENSYSNVALVSYFAIAQHFENALVLDAIGHIASPLVRPELVSQRRFRAVESFVCIKNSVSKITLLQRENYP